MGDGYTTHDPPSAVAIAGLGLLGCHCAPSLRGQFREIFGNLVAKTPAQVRSSTRNTQPETAPGTLFHIQSHSQTRTSPFLFDYSCCYYCYCCCNACITVVAALYPYLGIGGSLVFGRFTCACHYRSAFLYATVPSASRPLTGKFSQLLLLPVCTVSLDRFSSIAARRRFLLLFFASSMPKEISACSCA